MICNDGKSCGFSIAQIIHEIVVKHLTKPMNISNSSEKIPDTFYIFLSKYNLVSKHNIEKTGCIFSTGFFQAITETDKNFANKYLKGSISSFSPNYTKIENFTEQFINGTIDYLPFTQNKKINLGLTSLFSNSITSNYRTEYNCELSRKYYFPTYPSRMSSCYAFGDYETCELVSKKHNWDISSVRKFKLLPHSYNKVAKVNMEIISLERYANTISILDTQTQGRIWRSYWNGAGNIKIELPAINGRQEIESKVVWEYLVEGILKLDE